VWATSETVEVSLMTSDDSWTCPNDTPWLVITTQKDGQPDSGSLSLSSVPPGERGYHMLAHLTPQLI